MRCGLPFLRYHSQPQSFETTACELIAYTVGSHHGKFDIVDLNGDSGFEYRLNKDRAELHYDEAISGFLDSVADNAELDGLFIKAVAEVTALITRLKTAFGNDGQQLCFLCYNIHVYRYKTLYIFA